MTRKQALLRAKRVQILQAAARYGVQRLRVFGSVARGTDDRESDIDFLVELAPDRSLLDLREAIHKNPNRGHSGQPVTRKKAQNVPGTSMRSRRKRRLPLRVWQ